MRRLNHVIIVLIGLSISVLSCQDIKIPPPAGTTNIANPASVYCVEQGGKLEIRKAADGSEQGFCVFPDGSECEEWAFFRGECEPGQP